MDNPAPSGEPIPIKPPLDPNQKQEKSISADDFFSSDFVDKEKSPEIQGIKKAQEGKKKLSFFLKNIAVLIFSWSVFSFFWFTADLETQNKYFFSLGIENIGIQFANQTKKKFLLEEDLKETTRSIGKIQDKIKNKEFLKYQKEVDEILSDQLIWFDKKEDDMYLFGMIDIFSNLEVFFNDTKYIDPQKIISGRKDQLEIKNISVNRTGANISVESSHILGRVFFLTSEFIDIVNSIPFYKGASINSFSRKKNDLGDDQMTFSLQLKRQENPNKESQTPHPELDPSDSRFNEFLEWFNNKNK